MLTALSLYTEGFYTRQGFHLPFDRFFTIKGNIRDLTGYPLPEVEVKVSVFRPPRFNVQDLVAIDEIMVRTDADGEVSSNPVNQIRILRSTLEDPMTVKIRIPRAGGEWLVQVPPSVNLMLLKDLVQHDLVQDLSRR